MFWNHATGNGAKTAVTGNTNSDSVSFSFISDGIPPDVRKKLADEKMCFFCAGVGHRQNNCADLKRIIQEERKKRFP